MGKMHDALKKVRPAGAAAPVDVADDAAERSTTTVAPRNDADPRLVFVCDPSGRQAEEYRQLRENVVALATQAPLAALLVTSAGANEGKSITAANLACALAEDSRRKVVLVDADLRTPAQHRLFGLDHTRGLSDYLAGGTMFEMVVQRWRLPNLWVLPAGRTPPNPAELLGGKRMDDLLARLRRDYDTLILDGPAVLPHAEPAALAPRVDGTLLVVRLLETGCADARRAVEELKRARANVVGAVVTDLRSDGIRF